MHSHRLLFPIVTFTLVFAALHGCKKSQPKPDTPPKNPAAAAENPDEARKNPEKPSKSQDLPEQATAQDAANKARPDRPFVTFGLPQQAGGGRMGAVATAHPLATRAAARALHEGGTAVDALVAASFALTVVTPHSTGIGGGGFAVVYPTDGKDPAAFDFRETGPRLGKRELYLDKNGRHVGKRSQRHGLAVGVPGYVKGLWALHKRYGKRPWKELVTPAADIARRGFKVGEELSGAAEAVWDLLDDNARKLLTMPGGKKIAAGDILVQPKLAVTLDTIADKGLGGFYEGLVAADIIDTVKRHGGKLDHEDMRAYEVRQTPPLKGAFFGRTVLTMPQPSAGGAQLLAMAELLREMARRSKVNLNWPKGRKPGQIAYSLDAVPVMHALVEAMRRSFLLRLAYSGDPAKKATRLDEVYPKKARAKLLKSFSPKKATLSARLAASKKLPNKTKTSHVSIIDADGMAVSSTHTINLLFGSGILTPHTGIFLNDELDDFSYTLKDSNAFGLAGSKANMYAAGKRPVSSMTPVIVVDGGKPVLVIGAPGGTRIPTAVFQSAYRHLVDREPLKDAIDAPRLHNQAFPDVTWVEKIVGDTARHQALQLLGHKTVSKSGWCNVQAVQAKWKADGTLSALNAASDRRYEGGAMVLK